MESRSVDPDQTAQKEQPDQDPHCLHGYFSKRQVQKIGTAFSYQTYRQ